MKSRDKNNMNRKTASSEQNFNDSGAAGTAIMQGMEILKMLYIVGITRVD